MLDRTLPEWTVSSSLIEVARAVSELERDIAAHRGSEISDVVTSRLKEQTQSVADGLWSLADRIVVADRVGSQLLRDRLAREDEVLLRLLPAMQEARAGLTELVLAGSGADQLRRSEGRFRALAATAHDLKEFEPGPTPGNRVILAACRASTTLWCRFAPGAWIQDQLGTPLPVPPSSRPG